MKKYLVRFVAIALMFGVVACAESANNRDIEEGDKAYPGSEEELPSPAPVVAPAQVETEEITQTNTYGNKETFSRRVKNYAKEGLYTLYTKKGGIMEQAYYSNDTLHGTRVMYAENGDTAIVEHYEMGVFEGEYRSYYDTKQLEIIGNYVEGEMKGEWKRYYKNGQLMEVVTFEGNQENGPFVEYYDNGNLKAEGTYVGGDNEDGELKLYNEDGKLKRVMNCKHGICRTKKK